MTVSPNPDQVQEVKTDTSEANLAKQRKHYERQLEQERLARQQAEERALAAEKSAQDRSRSSNVSEEDDDDSEPYVDKRRLKKTLGDFEKNIEAKIDQKAEAKASAMIENERKTAYLRENTDFNKVLEDDTVVKFAERHPKLAEALLRMPEGFERQKLVYENIKALGIDKPEQRGPTVQEKIDANRKSPYYQPSGVGTAPYHSQSDFSQGGQKQAFDKMRELQKRLRLG